MTVPPVRPKVSSASSPRRPSVDACGTVGDRATTRLPVARSETVPQHGSPASRIQAMRLFLHELVCAGGLGHAPDSLRAEGMAMLAAVAIDFAAAGVRVTTLL